MAELDADVFSPNNRRKHKDNVNSIAHCSIRRDSFKDSEKPSSIFQYMQTTGQKKRHKSMQESNSSLSVQLRRFVIKTSYIPKQSRCTLYILGIIFFIFNLQLNCEAYESDSAQTSQEEMTISWLQFMKNDIEESTEGIRGYAKHIFLMDSEFASLKSKDGDDVSEIDEKIFPWNYYFGIDLHEYDKKLERLRREIADGEEMEKVGGDPATDTLTNTDTMSGSGEEDTATRPDTTAISYTSNTVEQTDTTEASGMETTPSETTASVTTTTAVTETAGETTDTPAETTSFQNMNETTELTNTTGSGTTGISTVANTTITVIHTTQLSSTTNSETTGSGFTDDTETTLAETTTATAFTTNITGTTELTNTTGRGTTGISTVADTTITVIHTTQLPFTTNSETTGSGFTDNTKTTSVGTATATAFTANITETTELTNTTGSGTTEPFTVEETTITVIDTTQLNSTTNSETTGLTGFTDDTETTSAETTTATAFTANITETTGSAFTSSTEINEATENATTFTETTEETGITQSETGTAVTTLTEITTGTETTGMETATTQVETTSWTVTTSPETSGQTVTTRTVSTTMSTPNESQCKTDNDCTKVDQYCSNGKCLCNPGTYLNDGTCDRVKNFGGKLHINETFDVELSNSSSEKFNSSSKNVNIFLTEIYTGQSWFISVQVVSFVPGSTVAQYNLVTTDSNVSSTDVQKAFDESTSNTSIFSQGCSCNSSECGVDIGGVNVTLLVDESCKDAGTSNDVLCDVPANSGYCNATTAVCSFSNSGDFSCACKSGDVLNPYDEQSRSCIVAICMSNSDCNEPFGTCHTSGNQNLGKCSCMTGFAGTNCYSPWLFVFIIVMSFLAFVLILFLLFLLVRRRLNRGYQLSKGNYYNDVWEVNETTNERRELNNRHKVEGLDDHPGIVAASYRQTDEPEYIYGMDTTNNGNSRVYEVIANGCCSIKEISDDVPMNSLGKNPYANDGFASQDELASSSSSSHGSDDATSAVHYGRSKL